MNKYIHSTAIVEDGAIIGNGTKVWVNAQIRSGAIVGDNCIISKDVFLDSNVKVGSRSKIQNGVSVYNGVTIEEDVFVGPNATFTNDKVPRAFNKDWQISDTLICKGSSIGANATIICGITIGKYSMVAAGAVVTKNVMPFTLVAGNPARPISKIDINGMKVIDE
jgi:acetyltransferase-like isoleucine patch superfamily enzyme